MTKSKKGFYSQVPVTKKAKAVAGTNPVGSVEHPGGRALKMVPGHTARKPPGRTTGLGEPHGWGHAPHQHKGALRISGYANAHQVGFKPPHVQAIPPASAPRGAGPIGKQGLPKLPGLGGSPKSTPPKPQSGPKHKLPKLPKLPKLL